MPRKRKPITILRIESMSTGREYRPVDAVDDWGQPIVPIADQTQAKPLASADELKDAKRRQDRADKRLVFDAIGILPMRSRPIEQTVAVDVPGKRAISIGSIALYVAKPSWRRL